MRKQISAYARSLFSVVKQLRLKGTITALTSQAEFAQLIKPLGERPLILSGHPGDEVMALGGAMAWYIKRKTPLSVLTFTAGMRGTNTGRLSRALGPKREKEQEKAFAVLGAPIRSYAWHLDEKFIPDEQLMFSLIELIDELNPDIIYTPSLLDNHPDSTAINQVLTAALAHLPSPRLKQLLVAQYELWTPLVPNKILSISEFQDVKQKAIECHESQLLCRNYLDAMLGLNRYRAAMLGAGTCAEAFFISSPKQYIAFSSPAQTPVIEMMG